MKIAYVTYQDQGKFVSTVENEDSKLLQYLQGKGLDLTVEIWNDPGVNWQQYEVAILKSPWDYFDRIQEFYAWLNKIKQLNVHLLNPVDVVKWNSDKHYLKDIANAGLPVVSTQFIEKNETSSLEQYCEAFKTDTLVVKPVVSGGSKNTFKFSKISLPDLTPKIEALLTEEAFMIQPFLKEIQTEGEWSFVFFNHKFSHCLLKKAQGNDFRVQHFFGGTIHPQEPPKNLLKQASRYVDAFAKDCLYARVDGVVLDDEFCLMELELIEPFLFLFTNPNSYENYYQALLSKISSALNPA